MDRPLSAGEIDGSPAYPLSRMSPVSHSIVDPTGHATDDDAEKKTIEEAQESPRPGDRIPR
jgi:hypothetical protein